MVDVLPGSALGTPGGRRKLFFGGDRCGRGEAVGPLESACDCSEGMGTLASRSKTLRKNTTQPMHLAVARDARHRRKRKLAYRFESPPTAVFWNFGNDWQHIHLFQPIKLLRKFLVGFPVLPSGRRRFIRRCGLPTNFHNGHNNEHRNHRS